MPLWGKKDTVYSTGKVNCTTAGVVTKESGSIAWTSGNGVKVGQVLTLATDGAGPGQGIIKSINSATEIQLDPEKLDLPGAFTDVDYEIRETPVYEVKGGSFGINQIFGVDVTEAQVARAASGDARKYKPAAAGWVGITTYIDTHGNFRVKSETLVAGGGDGFISADSTDDTKFADS
jgi:nucleoid-associated protein YgaU